MDDLILKKIDFPISEEKDMQDFQCFVKFITEFYKDWPEIPRATVRCLQLYDSSQGRTAYDKTVQLITILLERSPAHVLSFIISFIPLPKEIGLETIPLKNNNSLKNNPSTSLQRDSDGSVIIDELRYTDYNLYRWLEQLPEPGHFSPTEASAEASSCALSLSSNYEEITEAEDLSHPANEMKIEKSPPIDENIKEEKDISAPKNDEKPSTIGGPWSKVIGQDLPWTLENMALFRGVTCEEVLRDINEHQEIKEKPPEKKEEKIFEPPPPKKPKYSNSPTIILKSPHVEIRKIENTRPSTSTQSLLPPPPPPPLPPPSLPLPLPPSNPEMKNLGMDKSRNLQAILNPRHAPLGRNVKTLYMVPFHPGHPRPSSVQNNPGPLSRWRYHLPGPPPPPPPPPSGTHLHYHRSPNNFFNGPPPIVRPWIPSGRLPQKRPPQSGYMPHSPNFPTDGSLVSCRIICKTPQMLGGNPSVRMTPPPMVVTSTSASCSIPMATNDSLPSSILESTQLYQPH